MKFTERLKSLKNRGRFKKAISVNFRWALRRVRRFFRREEFKKEIRSSYARRLYVMLGLLLLIGGLTVASSHFCNAWLADEAVIVRRLSDPDFNRSNPILTALDSFGATNRIQVTLETERKDNLHPQKVDLDRGNLNLVLTLRNGSFAEYTLQNRRVDNFESGCTDQFTLILPDSISVFDITEYKLVLMPDAKGGYGSWHCKSAAVSFLLGGKRTLLASGGATVFSESMLSLALSNETENNLSYKRIGELFPYARAICANGHAVHDAKLKEEALNSLGMSKGATLYLDMETVGIENQNKLFTALRTDLEAEDPDALNYNGTMRLRVHFLTDAAGSYYKDYTLDTPGKDDFELGGASTFALEMPEGLTVFDIVKTELFVLDTADAWAPRMLRMYLQTDYGELLELARLTDAALAAERGTCIFFKGLIETDISPLVMELEAAYQLPAHMKEQIEKTYITEFSGVSYSMYFSDFNFYERQKLFYSQLHALYGGEADA